jgi:hypothetical protein
MGCIVSTEGMALNLNHTQILKTNISKLRFSCEISRQKIAKQLKDLEQILLN